jgi:hypothetical protein
MPLSSGQLRQLLNATEENEKATSPVDHMTTGVGGVATPAKSQDWLSYLRNAAEQRAGNAFVMLNLSPEGTPRSATPTRILSPIGFSNPVVYLFLPPGSYKTWTNEEARVVTQIVLHSFGQPWHAFKDGGKWKGYMNEPGKLLPMGYNEGSVARTAWIPSGSNEETMGHPERLGTALRALALGVEGTSSTHFIIDRDGTLYVMSDCNHILKSSGALSDTCISIALEEALYYKSGPDALHPTPLTWDPTGSEGSNLSAWDYSAAQYVTLTSLLFKLRIAYPALNTQIHSSSRNSVDASFSGYTMHGHLKDARPQDTDVAPHLQSEDEWGELFTAVGQQANLAAYEVWQRPAEGPAARTAWVEELVASASPENQGSNPWTSISPPMVYLAAMHRAHQMVLKTSKDYRRNAALLARQDSKLQESRLSVGRVFEAAAQIPPSVPDQTQLYVGKEYTVAEQRRTAVATDGIL